MSQEIIDAIKDLTAGDWLELQLILLAMAKAPEITEE
jgi:hypothetical protein